MIVYHVCSSTKLKKYMASGGYISQPVRAWEDIEQADRFSKSTDRKIILRLKFPDNAPKLEGHFGKARVIQQRYHLKSI